MGIPSCKRVINGWVDKAKTLRGQSRLAWFLQIFVAVQLLIIVYVNYAKAYGLFDYDSALAFRHGMEIWKHGLFLKDFEYYSSMETDSAAFLGSFLYLLTGNLKMALAVSHLIGCAAIAALVVDICGNLRLTREQSLMALAAVFTPYAAGQLDWANMLFICGGQYGFRVMTLLFVLDLLLMCENRPVKRKKLGVLLAACCLLVFWTSISTGNFVLFMILFPLLCWVAVEIYRERKLVWRSERTLTVLLTVGSALAGWILRSRFIGATHRESLSLVPADQLFENMQAAVLGVFSLFGGLAGEPDIAVFSVEGIVTLFHFSVPCCCLLIVWSQWHIRERRDYFARAVLLYSAVYFGVLLLLDTTIHASNIFEYRYHIPWCILLVISAGIIVTGKWKQGGGWIANAPVYGFLLLLISCNLWQDFWLIRRDAETSQFADVIEQGRKLGAETVYFYQKDEYASIVRLFVPEWYSVSVHFGDEGMEANTGDFYTSYGDRTAAGTANMLVCGAEEFEVLPAHIKSCYRQVDDEIYWSETNPWDGVSGLPCESVDLSVDFPYSGGYFTNGELAENGILVGNQTEGDDYLVRGPNTEPIPGTYDITLSYGIFQEGSQPSRLEVIVDDDLVLAQAELPAGQETVTLEQVEVPAGKRIEFRVWKSGDAIITVKQFTFERIR